MNDPRDLEHLKGFKPSIDDLKMKPFKHGELPTMLDNILNSRKQEAVYPEEFIRWLSVEIANREISLSLPVMYRYEAVEYTLPELFQFWKDNINQ